jgi:hypothetical protein
VGLSSANLWDNIWSNNIIDRVVFPRQFEMKLSWNATAQEGSKHTNYLLSAIQIDGITNKIKISTNFSTLSLKPQEFLSMIINL